MQGIKVQQQRLVYGLMTFCDRQLLSQHLPIRGVGGGKERTRFRDRDDEIGTRGRRKETFRENSG